MPMGRDGATTWACEGGDKEDMEYFFCYREKKLVFFVLFCCDLIEHNTTHTAPDTDIHKIENKAYTTLPYTV
jgi:hypothetical protein